MTKTLIISSVLYFILQIAAILDSQVLPPYEYLNAFVQNPLMRGFFNHDSIPPYDRQVVIHRFHSPKRDESFEYDDDYVEFELNPRLSSYLVSEAYHHSVPQHINMAPPINMPYNPYFNSYNMPSVQSTVTPATTQTPIKDKTVVTETIIISRRNNDVALTRKFNNMVINSEDEMIAKLVNETPKSVDKNKYILAMRNGNSDWKSIYGPGPFPHNLIEKLATTMQNSQNAQGNRNGTEKKTLSLKLFRAS